jgi:phosphate starvation-inducible PhoH-like protein
VRNVLCDIDGITFTHFSSRDVVRHPLVQKIVEAYAAFQEPAAGSGHDRGPGDRNAG